MSSTKNKTETKSKVDTCCSEPAKRKLLIKIGVGVVVATVLLVVIIAVAVVMATKSDDTGSNPSVAQTGSSNGTKATETTTVTTVTPPPTTERARILSVVTSQLQVDLSDFENWGSQTTSEVIALEEDKNIQWIYYETEDFSVYIIQKFDQRSQTIVATTRGPYDLQNNYNGTILFCEEAPTDGNFLTAAQIQESQPSRRITVASSQESFEVPSVILPLRTNRCHQLPERLRYKPALETMADMLGTTCSTLLQPDLQSNTSDGTFPGDRCNTKTNMVEECQCYKQCLDCTSGGSAIPPVPSCQCVKYMQSDINRISCTGTDDDVVCVQNRDSFKAELDQKPCSCSFGVYFAYPCGQKPDGCLGDTCELEWCFSGFTYKSPTVGFPKMCPITNNAIQCIPT